MALSKECFQCEQEEGALDMDAPSGNTTKLVFFPKPGTDECGHCLYSRRGSFPGISMYDLKKKRKEHERVDEKFSETRRESVLHSALHPKKRQRYENIDMELLTKKEEEDYVDVFEELKWQSLAKICNDKKPNNKFKTNAQRRKYVEEVLKMEVVLSRDGREGVAVGEDCPDEMKMVRGKRMSVGSVKNIKHDSKEAQVESHARMAAKLQVDLH